MTAIDTNVLIGLLNKDDAFNLPAKRALQQAAEKGTLIISAPVFVEMCAVPETPGWNLDVFLRQMDIQVDWHLEQSIWREAGAANARHVARRRKNDKLVRRIAADFLIGAHALKRGAELLTFDQRTFRAYFPGLIVVEA